MKNIAILGSTGSIGTQALAVIDCNRDRFRVTALAAGRNVVLLREQIAKFRPRIVAVFDEECARRLENEPGLPRELKILSGPDGYNEIAALPENDLVLSAMVGAAGLVPTVTAVEAGKDVALANKETLVMAGALVMEKAAAKGVHILPVDSEHSAIFQCLQGGRAGEVRRIILTASGGPFRTWIREELRRVRPEQALRHPNWTMGRKITIDSATMMNKGLEIIEALALRGESGTNRCGRPPPERCSLPGGILRRIGACPVGAAGYAPAHRLCLFLARETGRYRRVSRFPEHSGPGVPPP